MPCRPGSEELLVDEVVAPTTRAVVLHGHAGDRRVEVGDRRRSLRLRSPIAGASTRCKLWTNSDRRAPRAGTRGTGHCYHGRAVASSKYKL